VDGACNVPASSSECKQRSYQQIQGNRPISRLHFGEPRLAGAQPRGERDLRYTLMDTAFSQAATQCQAHLDEQLATANSRAVAPDKSQ